MKRITNLTLILLGLAALQACGGDSSEKDAVGAGHTGDNEQVSAPQVVDKPTNSADGTVSSPAAPFSMSYRVIGTPVIGVSTPIEIRIDSRLGTQPARIDYAIADASALQFPEAQPKLIEAATVSDSNPLTQQLTVIPQREGRHYVNVTVSVETPEGSRSLAMAVPVQVGGGGPDLEQLGETEVDEDGNRVRVLQGEGG